MRPLESARIFDFLYKDGVIDHVIELEVSTRHGHRSCKVVALFSFDLRAHT